MNFFKRIVLLILLLSVSATFAQTGFVEGVLKDADTKKIVEYANVSIQNADTKEFVTGTITDEAGKFYFSGLKTGNYLLTISFIGYLKVEKIFSVSSAERGIDFQNIFIEEDSKMLKEVEIVEMGSQMRLEIDKKVFDVDRNIASSGGSASEVLENIPSVQVDNEGEISLRGNSSVTIWINGKASGLSADNRAQILAQIPAETIERIEVITNPSAKYNPEGTAGIINIILKKSSKPGYYGSVQVGADTELGYNVSGNINYTTSKIEAFASLGTRANRSVGGGYSNRTNTDEQGNPLSYLNQTTESSSNGNNYNLRLGGTYHLTTKDHLGMSVSGMFGGRERTSDIDYESNIPNSYTSSTRNTNSESDMRNANIELNYKRDFTEKSHLSMVASYNIWERNETSTYEQQSLYADNRLSSSYQSQENDMGTNTWEFQADYVNEFGSKNKIEAGYQSSLSRRENPVETFSGLSKESVAFDESLYNNFLYNQDIHALYATYSKQIGNFGVQAGLRGEYSNINMTSLGFNDSEETTPPYKKEYFSLFPSVFFSYQLPKNNEIQLNYTRRISRPSGWRLNPFQNITDSANISYGNPYLDPEYSNSLELNYIKNWKHHIISASLYYKNTNDVIQSIRYMDGNVMKTTYENIAQSQSAGMELVVKNSLFKLLDLTTTLNLYYKKLDGFTYFPQDATEPVTGKPSEDFSWDIRVNAGISLPYSFSLQVTGSYNAPQLIAQGHQEANFGLDAGLRKTFFDKKLSLAISARNILNSQKRETSTSGNGFEQDAATWRSRCVVSFTLTYGFGNMTVKKTSQKKQQELNGSGNSEGEEF